MRENTYFQVCVYICICMIVFTMSINFVSAMGVFPTTAPVGFQTGNTTGQTFQNLTNVENETVANLGIDDLFVIILTGAALGGILVAWLTHSTTILGIYVFSVVFWASYGRALAVLGWQFLEPISGFIMIGTVGMSFIFAGAIAGMLSGSG